MTHVILETERLILRDIDPVADFEAWADCFSDVETMRYIGGKVMNRAEAWRNMAMVIGHGVIRGYTFLSVIEKSTGSWVGRVGPWSPEGWSEPEIGWTIHRDHWKKGYAKEAGQACLDHVFNTLNWSRVIHTIIDGNVGSIKTAESLGSKMLYTLDGIPAITDELCWVYGQERDAQ
ncbi:MAG: GNAT family N-acetyltransferase [Robiginitomaculum sp.]|nr:MAG: GNAT family N-acetyltransferase [Robiginitomaculum sp.]